MSEYHLKATGHICRVCCKKKKAENLRTINQDRQLWLHNVYCIDIIEEHSQSYYPTRICKGCASSYINILITPRRSNPKLGILGIGDNSRRITRTHDSEYCLVCEIFPGYRGVN